MTVEAPIALPMGQGSRRYKLWELGHRYHCPVIGVCFKLGEIRELVLKVMTFPKRPSDYEIHCTASSECGARSPLSSLLHKTLEKKFALAVQQCKTLKTTEELAEKWREAIAGDNIPAMFWAVLTHPASAEEFRVRVYGDIHMLQHQIGAGVRREQQAWSRLQEENAMLARELSRMQQRVTESCNRYIEHIADLKTELDSTRAESVQHQALAERHAAERDSLRERTSDAGENMRLLYRLQLAEGAYAALKERHAALETDYSATREDVRRLELELAQLIASRNSEESVEDPEQQHLQGRTVLCVGGRLDAIPHFRSLVKLRGGEFVHHDGGKEENIGRLEAVISAADAVICQTGCISHNAYWRVKEQCKRTGKPCTFVGNPSLSSFLQVLDHLAVPEEKESET
jgi:hypothetical protein